MPILHEFSVDAATDPTPDKQYTINFPYTFVARPRLPHGFSELDIGTRSDICVKSTNMYFTKTWADCHVTTWDETTLYKARDDVFILAPADLQYLTGDHMRNLLTNPNDPARVHVAFERPFVTPPKVVVFLNYIDLGRGHNWRLNTSAEDIGVNGFTLIIESSDDTVLRAAQACWVAYPEDEEHIFSCVADTADVQTSNPRQLRYSKAIGFNNDVEFWKVPSVFIALKSFDIDCRANLRINAYVDGITQAGLVWHIDTSGDTILYSARASIIAFN